ncbi:MAG: hypothetical protein WKF76_08245 [Nocardioidaceae bacterium]
MLAGVLVAVAVASVAGLTWWSLGVVVAVSLLLGRALRLGEALLGPHHGDARPGRRRQRRHAALGRVYETLVGAGVGVVVNAIIAPPLYVQSAADAFGELADRAGRVPPRARRGAARPLVTRGRRHLARRRAVAMGAEVERADRALARAEEGARLNPRCLAAAREANPACASASPVSTRLRVAAQRRPRPARPHVPLVPPGKEAFREEVRNALADILEIAATALPSGGTPSAASAAAGRAPREPPAGLCWPTGSRRCVGDGTGWPGSCSWSRATTRRPGSGGALLAAVDHLRESR